MKYRLSEIMDIIGGGTPKTNKPEYWNGDIPWLSVKDFNNEYRYVYETEKTITWAGLNNSSTKMLKRNDLIISARGTVGEIAMLPFPMAFNQSCYGLRAKEDIVNAEYLYYLIKHNVVILKKDTHGSVFDTITRGTFDGIEVELPSLQEQNKVVSVLRDYDNKIELNNKINENLEEQVSILYCQMFEASPSKKWENGTLSDIAIVSSGKRPPMKSSTVTDEAIFPIVGAASIMGFTNAANHNDKILVIGRVGTHGIVQRINSPCWTSDNTLVIKSDYYEYLYQILKRIDYSSLNRGSTQPLITQGDINKIPIFIPDKGTLSKYEEVAGTIMSKYETNMRENQLLAQIRDTLLPRLMSGELDVSALDI